MASSENLCRFQPRFELVSNRSTPRRDPFPRPAPLVGSVDADGGSGAGAEDGAGAAALVAPAHDAIPAIERSAPPRLLLLSANRVDSPGVGVPRQTGPVFGARGETLLASAAEARAGAGVGVDEADPPTPALGTPGEVEASPSPRPAAVPGLPRAAPIDGNAAADTIRFDVQPSTAAPRTPEEDEGDEEETDDDDAAINDGVGVGDGDGERVGDRDVAAAPPPAPPPLAPAASPLEARVPRASEAPLLASAAPPSAEPRDGKGTLPPSPASKPHDPLSIAASAGESGGGATTPE